MTKNLTHLKVGKAQSRDPIASAKASGTHFTNTTNHNKITPTRDSKPVASDGYLKGANSPAGARGAVTARHTYTGKAGSKRD